jgi:hypothetical protein
MRWTTLGLAIATPVATLAVATALLMSNQWISVGPVVGWLAIPLVALSPLMAAIAWREVPFGAGIGLSGQTGSSPRS